MERKQKNPMVIARFVVAVVVVVVVVVGWLGDNVWDKCRERGRGNNG